VFINYCKVYFYVSENLKPHNPSRDTLLRKLDDGDLFWTLFAVYLVLPGAPLELRS